MVGILIFNGDRPDIALDNGTLYGGLHCGDCFQYYDRGWMDVRLEYMDGWILVHDRVYREIVYGTQVKI